MEHKSLKGLEFKDFSEILDFDKKLSKFLDSLDEELQTWRDHTEKNGKRRIPHAIDGYACLDDENIVGIGYFFRTKKDKVRYFINLLFGCSFKEAEWGGVVKKEYQRRGISTHLFDLCVKKMKKLGYARVKWYADSNNIRALKWSENMAHRIVKRADKKFYFVYNLIDNYCDQTYFQKRGTQD